MDRSKDILTDDALVKHDGILIVVTLPRHVSHQEVTTQCQLTILGGVALGQDITLLHTLALLTDRAQVDGHILVRTAELRDAVFLQGRLEADKLLILCTVVKDTDGRSVNILHDTIALGSHHRTGILTNLLLNTGTHDRCFVMEQGHCLTHHVRSHQRTVSIIVLQERDQRSSDRSDLLRRDVHQVDIRRRHDGEVSILAALHHLTDKRTVVVQRRIALTDYVLSLFLGCQIDDLIIIEVSHTILNLTIRSLDEA